jgi:hypothetical protein
LTVKRQVNKVMTMDATNLNTPATESPSGQETEELQEFEFTPITPSDDLHEEEQLFMHTFACR